MLTNNKRLAAAAAVLLLAACSSQPQKPAEPAWDEIKDSGPATPVDMLATPEPTPVREPIGKAGNKSPYVVNGVKYSIMKGVKGYKDTGYASWYGTKFHGRRTANGEIYNMYAMSAAHKTLPLPSYAKVTNLDNGRSVIVRVNDRGPFVPGRIIDLSYTAAQKLGYIDKGVARVEVVALDPDTLPSATDTLVAEKDVTAREALAQDASFKLPSNTYLQVGAFSDRSQANRVRGQVASVVDYPVSVSPVFNGAKTLYRVRIGPLAQQRSLVAARESVEQNRLGTPLVVYD
ncbi:septal ring lytic transglycosylase RlpA family lipoprotein [Microbulbifer flavimaris]|uniref:Endolytic peptidoglycan transglycosylase RlpA n=1 Tax=Microbulbifer flavimaris TaxID=1781068 RepID=A0ABX4HYE5_9GAMM|nr:MULTISPECIES: septal ring lytic transglycosylase RlpA family protein [Microbulbifer]KUJ82471.1 sugar fermentation stimulation protein [Microbulbifer sp. ZGT114]PCO04675.1 septal ring lytic transglycosylase RlpA family lipoprotein [Microbulbifer flavimaris]